MGEPTATQAAPLVPSAPLSAPPAERAGPEPRPARTKRKTPRNRSNKRGSLILDRSFFGIGRIARATGTDDAKIYRAYSDMLTRCYEAGRHDVLEAIRDGRLTFAEAYAEYCWHKAPADLPGARDLVPLRAAVAAWLENLECSPAHARNLTQAMARLLGPDPARPPSDPPAEQADGDADGDNDDEGLMVGSGNTIRRTDLRKIKDLVSIAARHRKRCKEAGTPTLWNRDRAACLAFLRDQVGQHHRLWNEIKAQKPLKTRPQEAQHRNPQSPEQLRRLVDALGPVYGPMALSIALTGLDVGNYFERRWEVRTNHIWIGGTKRNPRKHLIPLIVAPVVPTRAAKSFR